MLKLFAISEPDLPAILPKLNEEMRDWTARAARGETAWICSDCGTSFADGMPDTCAYGDQRCNDLIARDKAAALKPS